MKTACYLRVSSVGQSLESQRAECQRWLTAHDVDDPLWFEDHASGKDLDRPAFQALQEAVRKGQVDCVVIFKLDRLSRSMLDGLRTIVEWLEAGVRLVAVSQQFDFSGAVGRMIAAVLDVLLDYFFSTVPIQSRYFTALVNLLLPRIMAQLGPELTALETEVIELFEDGLLDDEGDLLTDDSGEILLEDD